MGRKNIKKKIVQCSINRKVFALILLKIVFITNKFVFLMAEIQCFPMFGLAECLKCPVVGQYAGKINKTIKTNSNKKMNKTQYKHST